VAHAGRVAELGAGIVVYGDRAREGRMLDGPCPKAFAALRDAVEAAIGDPSYRRAARGVAEAIAALPPVDTAADLLHAIAARRRGCGE
jgi:UDP:flavonoid glycosyltransferase YjiC (YdhE family)